MKGLGGSLVAIACLPALLVASEALAFLAHGSWLAGFERLFGAVCHHAPERTLAVGARLLPVCARCTGLWLGAAAIGAAALGVPLRPLAIRRALVASAALTGGALAFALVEAAGLVHTTNALRMVLGAGLGAAPLTIAGIGGRLLVRGSLDG